ncbi:uncharacterized protein LOC144442670 [Glandiceps talaboti]
MTVIRYINHVNTVRGTTSPDEGIRIESSERSKICHMVVLIKQGYWIRNKLVQVLTYTVLMSRVYLSTSRCVTIAIAIAVLAALLQIRSTLSNTNKEHRETQQQQTVNDHKSSTVEKNNRQHLPHKMSSVLKAKDAAYLGMMIADSLAMPIHWYYNVNDIKRDFKGWLQGYQAPKYHHPSSILTISAQDGAGRSTFKTPSKPIIGRVILHDKLEYWTKSGASIHYHQGMDAGDNTLNVMSAIQVGKSIRTAKADNPSVSRRDLFAQIMTDYVHFMTTPGSHKDTYADSFHREYFHDWDASGSPVEKEKVLDFTEKRAKRLYEGHVDHNIESVSALVMPIPVILSCADKTEDEAAMAAVEFVKLTHCSRGVDSFVDLYARTLHAVLNGANLKDKVEEVLQSPILGGKSTLRTISKYSELARTYEKTSETRLQVYQQAVGQLGLACYMRGAFTSMFFLVYEFHNDFEGGVLTNANCGGEACGRGGPLGALLGAAAMNQGREIPQRLQDGLKNLEAGLHSGL